MSTLPIARLCPVCWLPIAETPCGDIESHLDALFHACPGSRKPYYITLPAPARLMSA